ncbi:hypothetical protein EMPS_02373 [Entomortierella parvispora]|uniref:Uncharacterized protein n=1 Tax=Entomortierella parvispora TaxID=205924 RepID=A0A9P3H4R8_9FUNG|nr:hypothetical protein EMPS_02373 [Entomortierella parvispora]
MPRQLRSKYDEEVTMAPYAAVHPLLNHHTTMPVTLKTLYAFKCKNEWSGIKVAAFVFYQMYSERRIAKQRVMEMLSCCKAKSGNTFKIVQRMVELMKEEETFPVSKPVCKCLTDLAGALSGEITSLNNTIVKPAVLKKLRSMAS